MLVKTLKRHRYDGKMREQGEEYEIAQKKHLRLLEAIGKIRRIPETITAPPKEDAKEKAAKEKAVKAKAAKDKAAKEKAVKAKAAKARAAKEKKKKDAKKKDEAKTSKGKYGRKDMVTE